MFVGLFGIAAMGVAVATAAGELPPFEYEDEDEGSLNFYAASQAPKQGPLSSNPYSSFLGGICRRCGSDNVVIAPSLYLGPAKNAWSGGIGAYQGFGWEAKRSQRARVQTMADSELFDLMVEILQESKRRRAAHSDFGRP